MQSAAVPLHFFVGARAVVGNGDAAEGWGVLEGDDEEVGGEGDGGEGGGGA